MAALCRLAVLSFLFGAALYPTVRIGVILYRLALAVFSRSVPKRRGVRILLSVLRGGLEGAAAVLVGVAFILFLYAAAPIRAVAIIVKEPPSSTLRAAPNNLFGR